MYYFISLQIEEAAGNMLMLSGPLIDVYLTKLGEEVASRLRRNNSTGLATFADFIPSQAFTPIMYLIQRYGGQVSHFQGRGPYGKVEIKITSLEVLEAVLSGERSDGRNYFMRQHFDRERTPDKKVISHYRGVTEVLVNEALPFTMQYSSSRHKVKVSFYRQKYDRNGMVENSVLQAAGSS
ncbi:PREDICTED: uncharacterized protein LOC109479596 [Branchiostoma belcheri]|uniref:Uncharacterized protein LOC109479596 n=1 Tax=Branchiostoma belcheri TaxID=7741 RepID=A0A6P5A5U9_BRABE|nr:PREDICTED: uncharacterized protein LOC109479596 [Branchiostoma belcheri]